MHYSIQDFIQLIAQLRNPNGGCPWDLKQNYESMIPCLTEETYEVIDAIQKKDIANLREELGDLLLQVVFFSQLASEDGYFTFDDVLNDISKKIVRRHPHVFCSKIGFDWDDVEPVLAKVEEELQEVRDEINQTPRNQEKIEEEIGDLFFATVNLSRHLNCNAEEALRKANHKFEQRFRKVEEKALERGSSVKDLSLIEMDILWDEVKREEK